MHPNSNPKRPRGTLNNINFKSKTSMRDKGHYTMIKRSIHQENITITYAPNIKTPPKCESNIDRIEGRNSSKIIVGDFDTY